MFTGLVEEVGTVAGIRRGRCSAVLSIRAERVLEGLRIGDSVAVDGVCLTVIDIARDGFSADAMHETLRRSTLATARPGRCVDLERALKLGDRLDGHIVAGHVDGTGRIAARTRDDNAVWYEIEAPAQVTRYVVEKGSVAIDGVSLTVAELTPAGFKVSIIPHTLAATALVDRLPGDAVNLEADIVGKYVERLLDPYRALMGSVGTAGRTGRPPRGPSAPGAEIGISRAFLAANGF